MAATAVLSHATTATPQHRRSCGRFFLLAAPRPLPLLPYLRIHSYSSLVLPTPLFRPGLGCRTIRQQQEATITQEKEDDDDEEEEEGEGGGNGGGLEEGNGGNGGSGGDGDIVSWISSALVFGLWSGLLIYASAFSPNQTPVRDQYFIQKLVGLQNDDFAMNQVLILKEINDSRPAAFISKNGVPVWPFASLSMFIGVFGLLPYFGLWKPPPPSISSEEIQAFPLKIFESKIFSAAIAGAVVVIIGFALLAGAESWTEFFSYFRESRFIHIMSIDFVLLSSLAPFWVYNDSVVRKWSNENIWLLALVPLLGPAFYLIFRPPIRVSRALD